MMSLLPSTFVRSAASAPRLLAGASPLRAFATSTAWAKPLNLPEENPFTQGRRGLPDQSLSFAPLTPAEKNRPNELKIAQQGSNQLSLETPNNGAGALVLSPLAWVGPGCRHSTTWPIGVPLHATVHRLISSGTSHHAAACRVRPDWS